MPPTVLFDVSSALGASGGVSRYIRELYREMVSVSPVIRLRPWAHGVRHRWSFAGKLAGPPLPGPWVKAAWRRGLFPLPHLFHATNACCPPRGEAPIVVTIHDLAAFDGPHWFEPRQKELFQLQTRQAVARADLLIVPSGFTRERLLFHFPEACERVALIEHGSDHLARLAGASLKTHLRGIHGEIVPLSGAPTILFVGTVQPRKGLRFLFRVLEGSTARLLVAGPAGWKCRRIFEAACDSPARDRIFFLGPVGDRDLVSLYRASTVLAWPSEYEGFGFPPTESAVFGLPVILAPDSNLAGRLGERELCRPRDGNLWAEALGELFERAPRSRPRMPTQAFSTWRAAAASTIDVYEQAFL